MREWLDTDSTLFVKQSRPEYAPASPSKIAYEFSSARTILEEQLAKRSLHEYLDNGLAILSEYRAELMQMGSNPTDPVQLKQIIAKLGKFCLDSDSWGFEDVYHVAKQLHYMTLEIVQSGHLRNATARQLAAAGLDLLESLLNQCEHDYDRRIAVASFLQGFAPDSF